MADLIDIAPVTETVEVRGHKLEVRGIKLGAAAEIMQRFPEIWQVLSKGGLSAGVKAGQFTDPAVAAIIAAGIKEIDEEGASNLDLDEQMELVATIWGLTARRGTKPFMKALWQLLGKLNGPASAPKTPAVSSGPQTDQPSKRAQAKRSPKSSKP